MKLFLSGGGAGEDSRLLDKKFIESIDDGKPVLYIPIAINAQKHPYHECLEWIKQNFEPLGFDNFIMWSEEDLVNKSDVDFSQFGGIYIGGGNTFKLLKELREYGTLVILRNLAEKGLPIYGGSAGAIILTKTIVNAIPYDSNDVGLEDLHALNLTGGVDIWCHYDNSQDSLIYEYQSNYNQTKIIGIPENAGLYVTKETIEIVGPGDAVIFTDSTRTIIEPGTLINI